MWECFNAFKENGKTYRYGDKITDVKYKAISERNKRWFFEIKKISDQIEQDRCPKCGEEYNDILGIGRCSKCFV